MLVTHGDASLRAENPETSGSVGEENTGLRGKNDGEAQDMMQLTGSMMMGEHAETKKPPRKAR